MKSNNTTINYFEYIDPSYSGDSVNNKITKNAAEALYEQISEFYMFLVNSIDPEDYIKMQEHMGYTESYEEHINLLTEGVPSRTTSIEQITLFLNQYQEFINKDYIGVLEQLNSRIQMNKDVCKMQAYEILTKQSDSFINKHEQIDRGMTQGKVEAIIGGKLMSFDTFNNPLLVSLYSLLLVWFSLKHYGEPPKPVIYTTQEQIE